MRPRAAMAGRRSGRLSTMRVVEPIINKDTGTGVTVVVGVDTAGPGSRATIRSDRNHNASKPNGRQSSQASPDRRACKCETGRLAKALINNCIKKPERRAQ